MEKQGGRPNWVFDILKDQKTLALIERGNKGKRRLLLFVLSSFRGDRDAKIEDSAQEEKRALELRSMIEGLEEKGKA